MERVRRNAGAKREKSGLSSREVRLLADEAAKWLRSSKKKGQQLSLRQAILNSMNRYSGYFASANKSTIFREIAEELGRRGGKKAGRAAQESVRAARGKVIPDTKNYERQGELDLNDI